MTKLRQLESRDQCEDFDCPEPAKFLVYSRNTKKVFKCCAVHGKRISEEDYPEYIDTCKNCGCVQGVG